MTDPWQNLIVISIVAAAAGWLARSAYSTLARKRKAGCGACPTCPTEGAKSEPQVVAIESLAGPPVNAQTTGRH